MENQNFTFKINNEFGRIDKVLSDLLSDFTRSQLQQAIKQGDITVNGETTKANYKVQPGDRVVYTVVKEQPTEIKAENIPLEVIYEDDTVAVVNKPSGMVVHPSKGHVSGTLVNALLHHIDQLSEGSQLYRPGIVHRIDKDTSGLLVIAKTEAAQENLVEQFQAHTTERKYIGLVHGEVEHDEGTINAPITRMTTNRLKRIVGKEGKDAVTHFIRMEQFHKKTLMQFQLETGRTHQIRVHMAYIDHPLVGDPMYGLPNDHVKTGQYLHAFSLGFKHPVTNEWLTFEAALPSYFEDTLSELRKQI